MHVLLTVDRVSYLSRAGQGSPWRLALGAADRCRRIISQVIHVQFKADIFDRKAMSMLQTLAPDRQVEAMRQFFDCDLAEMKNPSAYLSGIIRSVQGTRFRNTDKMSAEQFKRSPVSRHLEKLFRKCGIRIARTLPACTADSPMPSMLAHLQMAQCSAELSTYRNGAGVVLLAIM
jgi:Heterogeneous nuclear ribonucleoprotein Q acidic domain